MFFYKQLNPQSQQKLLSSLVEYTEEILLNDSSKLSYQLAYDQVYQLCRHQKQQKLLETVETTIRKVLPKAFDELNLQSNNFLLQVAAMIHKTQKNLQKIKDVCLYLDLNYCKRDMNIQLINKLNEIFLQQFFNRSELLQTFGKKIALEHLKDNQSNIKSVLQSIKTIDPQEIYFTQNFIRFYVPVLTQYYRQQSTLEFTQHNTSQAIHLYIEFANENLSKESQFLNKFFSSNKKCAPNKEFVLKQLYQILVTQYKQQMYATHKDKIFNELTLQILELFKYGNKNSDIQKHADWYNGQIKEKLETFSHEDNTQFMDTVCDFYKKIMGLLEKTYNKFDIHYRSRFAFQEWINTERLQMPLRLNQYIKDFCLEAKNNKQQTSIILERISIVFILMKQKKVFEKIYRRELIDRILGNSSTYDIKTEMKIIQIMEKQCSEDFVKDINPIVDSYHKDVQSSVKKSNDRISALFINTQNWPYDEKSTSTVIHPNLTVLAEKQKQLFAQTNKDKNLYWHPIIGVVKLQITFLKSKWSGEVFINTCMANIILNFIKTKGQSFELKNYCCETGYKYDEIYDSVRKLIDTNILLNSGNQQNYKLSLNEEFTNEQKVFNVLKIEAINKFEAKPLEQLKADRKFMVEAIIVKIMKKLKNTDKQTICKQAAPHIEKRGFNFNAKFVQSAIERLVDKEFIRDFQDGRLGYIA